MKRSPPRTLLVAKSKDRGWSVSSPGSASGETFPTKDAAVKAAGKLAREGGGLVTVVDAKGGVGKSFTLGRSAMTKLNAVEGVVLGRAGEKAFARFDRVDATPAQRRAVLRKDLAKLAVGSKSPPSARSAPKR